jgi:hypothetical protein
MYEYGDAFWPSAENPTTSSHSLPAQQDGHDTAEDMQSDTSSGDDMPPLSEPLANGAGDLPAPNPPTVQGVHTISPLSSTSNESLSSSNPSGATHDNPDEPLTAPTHASDVNAREDTVIGEANTEDQGQSVSDLSIDADSMPSLIDTSELVPVFSSVIIERTPREGSGGTPDNLQRDRESTL